jgi:hypothetical protein
MQMLGMALVVLLVQSELRSRLDQLDRDWESACCSA